MVFVTFFLTVTLSVYTFYVLHEERKSKIRKRLGLTVEGSKAVQQEERVDQTPSAAGRIIVILFKWIKRFFRRRLPGSKEARIEIKLLQAGRPFNMTPVDFRLAQTAIMVILPITFGAYGFLLKLGSSGLVLLFLLGSLNANLLRCLDFCRK